MQKIKNNAGITLVMLVIVIVILLILAGVSILSGTVSINTSEDQNNIATLDIVKQAVVTQYQKALLLNQTNIRPISDTDYSNKPDVFKGTIINQTTDIDATGITWEISEFNYYEDFYYRLKEEDLIEIGITNGSNNIFVVNYKTGEVYNEKIKETSDGKKLYIKSVDLPTISEKEIDTTFSEE